MTMSDDGTDAEYKVPRNPGDLLLTKFLFVDTRFCGTHPLVEKPCSFSSYLQVPALHIHHTISRFLPCRSISANSPCQRGRACPPHLSTHFLLSPSPLLFPFTYKSVPPTLDSCLPLFLRLEVFSFCPFQSFAL